MQMDPVFQLDSVTVTFFKQRRGNWSALVLVDNSYRIEGTQHWSALPLASHTFGDTREIKQMSETGIALRLLDPVF
jgi:hypothetical protein